MESEKSSREKGIYKVTIVGSVVNFLLLVLNSLPELPGIVRLCWPMLSIHYPTSSPILLSLSLSISPGSPKIRGTIMGMANMKHWLRPSSGCYFCVSALVSSGMVPLPFILFAGRTVGVSRCSGIGGSIGVDCVKRDTVSVYRDSGQEVKFSGRGSQCLASPE